jgi:hypothetical protein
LLACSLAKELPERIQAPPAAPKLPRQQVFGQIHELQSLEVAAACWELPGVSKGLGSDALGSLVCSIIYWTDIQGNDRYHLGFLHNKSVSRGWSGSPVTDR